jgi:hypothetical protein
MVVVERAQADQVSAVPREFDTARFRQPLQRDLPLQTLDRFIGNPRHSETSLEQATDENAVKRHMCYLR